MSPFDSLFRPIRTMGVRLMLTVAVLLVSCMALPGAHAATADPPVAVPAAAFDFSGGDLFQDHVCVDGMCYVEPAVRRYSTGQLSAVSPFMFTSYVNTGAASNSLGVISPAGSPPVAAFTESPLIESPVMYVASGCNCPNCPNNGTVVQTVRQTVRHVVPATAMVTRNVVYTTSHVVNRATHRSFGRVARAAGRVLAFPRRLFCR